MFRFFGQKRKTKIAKSRIKANRNIYSAVKIIPSKNSCEEAQPFSDKILLSTKAPLLPLPNCSLKENCQCRYKHFEDRRQIARRDSDQGFPSVFSGEERRRSRIDRRAS
jgi:hypothetical protein